MVGGSSPSWGAMNTKELNGLFNHYYHLDELVEFPDISALNLTKDEVMSIIKSHTNAYDAVHGIIRLIRSRTAEVIASKLRTNRDNLETY